MAWHKRFISSINGKRGSVRLTVEFRRLDYLWISPHPVFNPVTGEMVSLPLHVSETVAVGANVLDLLDQETRDTVEATMVTAADGSQQTMTVAARKVYWRLRSPEEFFPRHEADRVEEHPLRKGLTTGGTIIGEQDGFLVVEKRSTVSISALVYRLVVGMTGGQLAATRRIGDLAAKAWKQDIQRAYTLYQCVLDAGGSLADDDVPDALKASASVGQSVETAILREACIWFGIDPDTPIHRQRGRPRSQRNEVGEAVSAGKVIELTLQSDGTVTGRLITDYHGLYQNTGLATLTLTTLAEILVSLRESELLDDADLLEAYLDAVKPDWRERIAEEIGIETNEGKADSWAVLGVAAGATLEEVKKAYRQIMRVVHPDTSGLPRWYVQTANDAYNHLMKELES